MSKQNDIVLLVPGKTTWEIWTRSENGPFVLSRVTEEESVTKVSGLPQGDLIHLFPVRSFTALPFRASSSDESMFEDLALMHAERSGVRPDVDGGQLADTFEVAKDAEGTALLAVVLRTPGDGDLPARSAKEFDLSARVFLPSGDALAIWKELGRWVFSIVVDGKLLYSQATLSEAAEPDDALVAEIRITLAQLALQGLDPSPDRVLYWTDDTSSSSGTLARAFGSRLVVDVKPAPALPVPRSRLLPADARAARHAQQVRRRVILGSTIAAACYLGLLGWLGYGLWVDSNETASLKKQLNEIAPQGAGYQEHVSRWSELGPVVEADQSPVELFFRVFKAMPSVGGIRLKSAEISVAEIKLMGEAGQSAPINQFGLALTKSDLLTGYKWEIQSPTQTPKGWDFVFTGTSRQFAPTQH
jgi:hypothetical protein